MVLCSMFLLNAVFTAALGNITTVIDSPWPSWAHQYYPPNSAFTQPATDSFFKWVVCDEQQTQA